MEKFELQLDAINQLLLERRHVVSEGIKTTVALEHFYWEAIDLLAKQDNVCWQKWVQIRLGVKPQDIGRARWLRVVISSVMQQLPEVEGLLGRSLSKGRVT